jgi:secreted PhoX family phosphatase
LQVLQVIVGDHVATFESQAALNAPDQLAIRTHGISHRTRWITIHDTRVDGTTPFNANTLAKAAGGTPFKRPENGVFRPGSHFREFFFTETGDTTSSSAENGTAGGWCSIFRLSQHGADADEGRISLFFQSRTATVAGLDNVTFLSEDRLLAVEDAGDGLHSQRNALDSGFVFDLNTDYGQGALPIRFLAEGRDPSATLDSANGGFGKNEGDNEITGIHVSDGDPSVNGILGAKVPRFGHDGWRMFWTQQHGDNVTWEVTRAKHGDNDDDHDDW